MGSRYLKIKNMNVLITGGNFFNAGAEAMTLTAISEIRKRNKSSQIYILCSRNEESRVIGKVDAKVLEYHQLSILYVLGGQYKFYAKIKNYIKVHLLQKKSDDLFFSEYQKVLKKIDLILDVSGLILRYKKSEKSNLDLYYMYMIMFAHKKNIPIILMPQSFGPFEYSFGIKKTLMTYLMKKYLSYPICIYAREKKGYNLMKEKFNLTNIVYSTDLVLQTQEIKLDLVLKTESITDQYLLPSNTVAIIPHSLHFSTKNYKNKFLELYKDIIKLLLDEDKEILVFCHADGDIKVLGLIKDMYPNESKVKYLNEKIDSISYCQIIKQCQFAIAGRYHSIVHAYKEKIPCITFGWAEKYEELFSLMKQEKYYFDMDDIDINKVLNVVREMCNIYPKEKNIIEKRLEDIQKDNCFAILDNLCRQES